VVRLGHPAPDGTYEVERSDPAHHQHHRDTAASPNDARDLTSSTTRSVPQSLPPGRR
jgi:hypothetical protein